MRCGLLILYLFLLVTGCKKKEKIPADILPASKMQAVLWDMMRADQFLTDYRLNKKDTALNTETESIKLYRQIFTIHAISKEQFQESFTFYQSHPALLKGIMDSMSKPVATQYGRSNDVMLKADSQEAVLLKDTSRPALKKKIRLLDKN